MARRPPRHLALALPALLAAAGCAAAPGSRPEAFSPSAPVVVWAEEFGGGALDWGRWRSAGIPAQPSPRTPLPSIEVGQGFLRLSGSAFVVLAPYERRVLPADDFTVEMRVRMEGKPRGPGAFAQVGIAEGTVPDPLAEPARSFGPSLGEDLQERFIVDVGNYRLAKLVTPGGFNTYSLTFHRGKYFPTVNGEPLGTPEDTNLGGRPPDVLRLGLGHRRWSESEKGQTSTLEVDWIRVLKGRPRSPLSPEEREDAKLLLALPRGSDPGRARAAALAALLRLDPGAAVA